jgi:poly [ADP-ribose] polymerase 2/3/4
LKCKIKSLDKKNLIYTKLEKYIQNTREGYTFNIKDIYELEREGEKENYNPMKLKNKKLLFHGSRFTNFTGILGNGLRIAPPEAPSHGYNFGKGVYLADMSSKSVPYCAPYLSNNEVLLIICEAALGNSREL